MNKDNLKRNFLIGLVCSINWFLPAFAWGCSCAPPPENPNQYYSIIVQGEFESDGHIVDPIPSDVVADGEVISAWFKVAKVIKGSSPAKLLLQTYKESKNCGVIISHRYLYTLYFESLDEKPFISSCDPHIKEKKPNNEPGKKDINISADK